jgi:hypothetical protein
VRTRIRIGPFTFGSSGTRLSIWRKGSGFSIPLFNKKASSFGKIKLGFLLFFFGGNRKKESNKNIKRKYQVKKNLPSKAYEPWSEEADKRLIDLYNQGKTVKELSEIFGRTSGAISSRLRKLL